MFQQDIRSSYCYFPKNKIKCLSFLYFFVFWRCRQATITFYFKELLQSGEQRCIAVQPCLCSSVCVAKCVCGSRCSCILFSQWLAFLFSSTRSSRAVECLETASKQKSFRNSAIQGLWKCTHSLAQLVPPLQKKGVPAWQISTQNVSWLFSTATMSLRKLAHILRRDLACYCESREPGKLAHLLPVLGIKSRRMIRCFPTQSWPGSESDSRGTPF